jgi:exosortase A-associated hydrolase 1/exosortase A-associated hydrolase 2
LQRDATAAFEAIARFEAASDGPRFVLIHQPTTAAHGTVVLLPPLAEELNKCRRMFAQTARTLAAAGWRVVQVDLFGCGDSDGDFGEATWQHWIGDLQRAIERHHRGGALWLWAVRAGALLLGPLLRVRPSANVVLWQPAHDGAAVLNQFLRLRASTALLGGDGALDRKQLREQLARGEAVEVAGYTLAPAIANPLAQARLELPPNFSGRIAWFEVVDDGTDGGSPAAQRTVEGLRAAGHQVRFESVVGPPFWQTVEIAEAPALLEATRAALARHCAEHAADAPVIASADCAPDWSRRAYRETVAWIACGAQRMLGIQCEPNTAARRTQGVLIVVGGPQYRVGSHRQFVSLARRLAEAGFVSLRFDYRGMGDSEGDTRNFEQVADDLRAALDALYAAPGVRSIVVWGLCDAASAALMFCSADDRVSGLVLVNPWARSEVTLATTHLKHYYRQRLLERDFWTRLLRGRFDWRASLRDLASSIRRVARGRTDAAATPFQTRMAAGWRAFRGSILLALSGRDLTAREFLEYASSTEAWRALLDAPNVRRVDHGAADHTFSTPAWQTWLEQQTVEWLCAGAERQAGGSRT